MSVPRFGVSWFFRLHVEASAHGSSGPPVLPVGSLVLWSSWLTGCGHRIIRSIAAKKKMEKWKSRARLAVFEGVSNLIHPNGFLGF